MTAPMMEAMLLGYAVFFIPLFVALARRNVKRWAIFGWLLGLAVATFFLPALPQPGAGIAAIIGLLVWINVLVWAMRGRAA